MLTEKDKEVKRMHKMKAEFALLKNRMKFRLQQHESTLSKLENGFAWMEQLMQKFTCLIEQNRGLIQEEREENLHILQLLENRMISCSRNLKLTQTVNPMVSGLPLKRATIALKRINPFHHERGRKKKLNRHFHNILGDRTNVERRSTVRGDKHVRKINIPTGQNKGKSSFNLCLNNSDHNMCHHSSQGISLKRASIHLKRLDPRIVSLSELPEDISHSIQNKVRNVRDVSTSVEAGSFETEEAPAADSIKSEDTSPTSEGESKKDSNLTFSSLNFPQEPVTQNLIADVHPCQSPMVVLERLERYEYFNGMDSSQNATTVEEQSSDSSGFNPCSDCIVPNERHNSVNICDANKAFDLNFNKVSVNEQVSRTSNTITSHKMCSGKKPLVALVDIQDINGKCNSYQMNKQQAKTEGSTKRSQTSQRKRTTNAIKETGDKLEDGCVTVNVKEETTKKKKKGSKNGGICEEDPLEGPSWLYNSGLSEADVLQFNKRRCVTLSLPQIYESSDESVSDEPVYKKKKILRERREIPFRSTYVFQ